MYILNGKLVDKETASISLCDHGLLYGDGVYETLRTIKGESWLFSQHMQRLRASANAVGIKIPYTNNQLKNFVEQLIHKNGNIDQRIRITITRGCNDFDFVSCKKPTLIVQAKQLKTPQKKLYKKGTKVITYQISRPAPQIKSTSMLAAILAYREAQKKKAFETLLVDEKGYITEASMSNFFAMKNQVLYAPEDNILSGTVRNYLIKLLKPDFEIKFLPIPYKNIYDYDELFITSTVKGVVPIVEVDNKKIAEGKVGPNTLEIMQIFFNSLQ